MDKILKVANVEKYYGNRSNLTKAIDNISFDVLEGEFKTLEQIKEMNLENWSKMALSILK